MSGKARLSRTDRTTLVLSERERFLTGLRKGLSVQGAADEAGIGRRTAYDWREQDTAFAAQWDDALESGTDKLEDALMRRALTISDGAATFLLKTRRPERYRDRTSVTIDGEVKHEHGISDDAAQHLADIIARGLVATTAAGGGTGPLGLDPDVPADQE